ncbi:hypothetical protein CYLTODRAFT_437062 [Cylindrobasidium torrendii FP15055 ss-10]|uniref:RRM domain-containing protein n=1 Tax=Cylindrobasidium torrendii FP15055 ss-10 TaxID=1314674 RepID=A0A0D7BAV2_9AGAR|nr:hypothetical protein CYLTODRAFT_437062 [Cylindrobasidium torrendii FP15055 ss-10]
MADTETTHPPAAAAELENMDDDISEEDKEIMLMKKRVEEMEAEAAKLREMQAEVERQSEAAQEGSASGDTETQSAEDQNATDIRSVYVGNVDYNATPEEIQGHFQACGVINRVTILCDKFTGHPKGYAYVEFSEPEHVDAAVAMNESLFRGRLIKVPASPTFTLPTMLPNLARWASRSLATSTRTFATAATEAAPEVRAYPFSTNAIRSIPAHVHKGRGIMPYLIKTLGPADKREMIWRLFNRKSPEHLIPGSIVSVTQEHAPTQFTGVLLAVRRRGVDSTLLVRNIVNRTGVEIQVHAMSPHVKEIKLLRKPVKRTKRAKLYFLRDDPDKMSQIASSARKL